MIKNNFNLNIYSAGDNINNTPFSTTNVTNVTRRVSCSAAKGPCGTPTQNMNIDITRLISCSNRHSNSKRLLQILPLINIAIFAMLLCLLNSCKNFEKEIAIKLPPFKSKLAVECYIENLPETCAIYKYSVRALVTETQDYFAQADTPLVDNAKVVLKYDGKEINLAFKPGLSGVSLCHGLTPPIKVYNYVSQEPIDFKSGTQYSIEVSDNKGRNIKSSSTWQETVDIDKIDSAWSERDTAYNLIVRWKDDGSTEDYYRISFSRVGSTDPKRTPRIRRDVIIADGSNNGSSMMMGTNYSFKKGDIVDITLYHIPKAYYQYVRTLNLALNSAGNPFGQPAAVESNIIDGSGIFTVLPGSRRQVRF